MSTAVSLAVGSNEKTYSGEEPVYWENRNPADAA